MFAFFYLGAALFGGMILLGVCGMLVERYVATKERQEEFLIERETFEVELHSKAC